MTGNKFKSEAAVARCEPMSRLQAVMLSLHSSIAVSTGTKLSPISVREYSTFGGISCFLLCPGIYFF